MTLAQTHTYRHKTTQDNTKCSISASSSSCIKLLNGRYDHSIAMKKVNKINKQTTSIAGILVFGNILVYTIRLPFRICKYKAKKKNTAHIQFIFATQRWIVTSKWQKLKIFALSLFLSLWLRTWFLFGFISVHLLSSLLDFVS